MKKFQPFSPGQPASRSTRQGALTRLDYCFLVNTYQHLTAKGLLPAAVIQPGVISNLGSCKGGLSWGAVRKTAGDKIGEKRGERKRFSHIFSPAVFRTAPQLTERLEEA